MSFEQLLTDIQSLGVEQETLSKALPSGEGEDDDKIQAAADDGKKDEEDLVQKDGDDEDGDKPMSKSLGVVTLENGEQVDAIDGTELVKSLMARVETSEGQMQKALEGAVGLIKSQGAMIKSLSEQVSKLAGAGRGRKAVVTVTEKTPAGTPMNKSEAAGMTGQEFMAKALSAQAAGKILAKDVSAIEMYLNRGMQIPEHLIARVSQ
jgi:hypothetical protein